MNINMCTHINYIIIITTYYDHHHGIWKILYGSRVKIYIAFIGENKW